MKFTDPKVEWWPQESIAQQIAKVGRICYKAKGKQPPENLSEKERKDFEHKRDMERSKGFWQSGHRSMYRHGTCYFLCRMRINYTPFIYGRSWSLRLTLIMW